MMQTRRPYLEDPGALPRVVAAADSPDPRHPLYEVLAMVPGDPAYEITTALLELLSHPATMVGITSGAPVVQVDAALLGNLVETASRHCGADLLDVVRQGEASNG